MTVAAYEAELQTLSARPLHDGSTAVAAGLCRHGVPTYRRRTEANGRSPSWLWRTRSSDWYPLLDLCGYRQCLIADRDGIYDRGSANGRLLLGLKGTISEVELHTLRGRLTAGLLSKAERGELALLLPAGLERDANGVVMKESTRKCRIGLP